MPSIALAGSEHVTAGNGLITGWYTDQPLDILQARISHAPELSLMGFLGQSSGSNIRGALRLTVALFKTDAATWCLCLCVAGKDEDNRVHFRPPSDWDSSCLKDRGKRIVSLNNTANTRANIHVPSSLLFGR